MEQRVDGGSDGGAGAGSRPGVRDGDDARYAGLRVGYGTNRPLEDDLLADGWVAPLRRWIAEAADGREREPNAMVLATVDANGRASTRAVLCKGVEEDGLLFFTNQESRKGRALAATGRAAATFLWLYSERQVHLEGPCPPLSRGESLAYWRTRPRGSQIAAWASRQSRPADSRDALAAAIDTATARFEAVAEIPMPDYWGGYRLRPETVEFWQGGRDRFHERIRVTRGVSGAWFGGRVQP